MTAVWFVVAVAAALALGLGCGAVWERRRKEDQAAAGTHRLPQRVGRPKVRPYEPPSRYVVPRQNAGSRDAAQHHSDGGRP